jgi:cold shock CspA family protein
VKSLQSAPHARVGTLFPADGYGFLAMPDGREIYFHRDSVLHDGFDRLEVGTEVAFVEELREEGPSGEHREACGPAPPSVTQARTPREE